LQVEFDFVSTIYLTWILRKVNCHLFYGTDLARVSWEVNFHLFYWTDLARVSWKVNCHLFYGTDLARVS
jgi:hypothetical protein